jgi:hypothetical protein
LAVASKLGELLRTTQKRWPVGASMTHHVCTCATRRAPRAEGFQAPDLSLDVVGLDVKVHAARVIHRLHLDVRLARAVDETHVLPALLARQRAGLHAERVAPEIRRRREVVRAAVDDEAAESALVHRSGSCVEPSSWFCHSHRRTRAA